MAFATTSLIAEFDPLSATIQSTPGWSSLNRAVSACTAGSAPPPPLALYVPDSGWGVGEAGTAPPQAASMRRARAIPATAVALWRGCPGRIITSCSGTRVVFATKDHNPQTGLEID